MTLRLGDPDFALSRSAIVALTILSLLCLLAAGSWLGAVWQNTRRGARSKARARRAIDGENRSEAMLARAGFTLLARQPRLAYAFLLDGDARTVDLRADWLVERAGRRFVADTKTGGRAPSLEHAPTRRQLLEYRVAYDVHGVLLIDAEKGTIHEVEFPVLGQQPRSSTAGSLRAVLQALAMFALGVLAAFAGLLGAG